MVEIQPFKFQKSTNIEEHNQMKDKINEMVEVINNVNLDNLPSQINALETEVASQGNEIDALKVAVDAIPGTYAKKSEIPDVSDFITADALTPYAKIADVDNADVTGVDASISNGEITIKLTRPDGDMSDSIDCPFIQTATLIPTSTARAFKIRFTYTDGTQYDTNEFVIPEGGGSDVSVTGVTVGDGTAPNSFKVAIQLSDTTTIGSNDYTIEFPENVNTYPTTLTATLNGTTLNMTIRLNDSSTVKGTADLSGLLTNYATKSYVDTQVATKLDKTTADGYYQPKGNYLTTVPIASATTLGGVKIGSGVSVGADGTISVSPSSKNVETFTFNDLNSLIAKIKEKMPSIGDIIYFTTMYGLGASNSTIAGTCLSGTVTNIDNYNDQVIFSMTGAIIINDAVYQPICMMDVEWSNSNLEFYYIAIDKPSDAVKSFKMTEPQSVKGNLYYIS